MILLSPPFGRPHMLSMTLRYDRWYYDVSSGNTLRVEVSNDGGANWTLLEQLIYDDGGWVSQGYDLFALLPPSDDMRLRFRADDDFSDDAVEAAVDEVHIEGVWVSCQPFTPPAMMRPNPVGNSLRVSADPAGHAVLTWTAPPVDAGHDAATLYRIARGRGAAGPLGRGRLRDLDPVGRRRRAHRPRRRSSTASRPRTPEAPSEAPSGGITRVRRTARRALVVRRRMRPRRALPGCRPPGERRVGRAGLGGALASAGPDDRIPVVVLMEEFPARDGCSARSAGWTASSAAPTSSRR